MRRARSAARGAIPFRDLGYPRSADATPQIADEIRTVAIHELAVPAMEGFSPCIRMETPAIQAAGGPGV